MNWRDTLSADELRERFDRKIAPRLIANGSAEEQPFVLFVGAQPGAGKSRAMSEVLVERTTAVPVVGDDFRQFHPDYRELMRTDPLAMPAVTAQASGAWVGMSAEYLRSERRSVLLETTMRQLPVVEATANAFRSAGYRVEARVLAVPGAVSVLGTVTRYLGEASAMAQNRWTPSIAHDTAYEAMPHTVEQLVARDVVDRITVTTRTNRVLYDEDVTGANARTVSVDARRAIEDGRSTTAMTNRDGHAWVRGLVDAAAAISALPQVADDLRETMRRLGTLSGEIIRQTFEPAQQAAVLASVAAAMRTGPEH